LNEYDAWPAIFDITRTIRPGIAVWPGDPAFDLTWASSLTAGDASNVARVSLGVHTGTHVDAPHHILSSGAPIDEIALDTFIGKVTVADAAERPWIDAGFVRHLLSLNPEPHRLIFRTAAWAAGADTFPNQYPSIAPEAAEVLTAAGIVLVGTDAPSVDPPDSADLPAHHTLLSAGTCILENLLLDDVPPGDYELIALPLRIAGADASPVRAVLRTL
jgi:arylformamidase